MKSLIAVVAGIIVSAVTGAVVQWGGDALLSAWLGIESITAQGAAALGIERAVQSLQVDALGYFLGPLAGGYVAARLAPVRPRTHAVIVGAFQMVFAVVALMMFPHPIWFAVATFLAFVPGALVGAALSRV